MAGELTRDESERTGRKREIKSEGNGRGKEGIGTNDQLLVMRLRSCSDRLFLEETGEDTAFLRR